MSAWPLKLAPNHPPIHPSNHPSWLCENLLCTHWLPWRKRWGAVWPVLSGVAPALHTFYFYLTLEIGRQPPIVGFVHIDFPARKGAVWPVLSGVASLGARPPPLPCIPSTGPQPTSCLSNQLQPTSCWATNSESIQDTSNNMEPIRNPEIKHSQVKLQNVKYFTQRKHWNQAVSQ